MLHPIYRLLRHLSDVELTQLLAASLDHFLLDFVAHLLLFEPFYRSVFFHASSFGLTLLFYLILPDVHI